MTEFGIAGWLNIFGTTQINDIKHTEKCVFFVVYDIYNYKLQLKTGKDEKQKKFN
jgi:hypothetical protein